MAAISRHRLVFRPCGVLASRPEWATEPREKAIIGGGDMKDGVEARAIELLRC